MPRDDKEGVLKLIMPADTFQENRRSEQCYLLRREEDVTNVRQYDGLIIVIIIIITLINCNSFVTRC